MEVIPLEVTATRSVKVPFDETTLAPIGDVHYQDGRETDPCNVTAFRRHLEEAMKRDALLLGMGDMLEVMSPSNRRALAQAQLYDSVRDMLEEAGARQLEGMQDMLKGTEGHWIGMLEGHHYYEFEDGTTSDTRLCQFLKAPFLGTCGYLGLKFQDRTQVRERCNIWCHHGIGSARTLSGSLSFLERLPIFFPQADIILMGHRHVCLGVKAPGGVYVHWDADPPRVDHRERILGFTGSFHRGYMQGYKQRGRASGTYVERALYPPASLGGMFIRINPIKRHDHYSLKLNVEQ